MLGWAVCAAAIPATLCASERLEATEGVSDRTVAPRSYLDTGRLMPRP